VGTSRTSRTSSSLRTPSCAVAARCSTTSGAMSAPPPLIRRRLRRAPSQRQPPRLRPVPLAGVPRARTPVRHRQGDRRPRHRTRAARRGAAEVHATLARPVHGCRAPRHGGTGSGDTTRNPSPTRKLRVGIGLRAICGRPADGVGARYASRGRGRDADFPESVGYRSQESEPPPWSVGAGGAGRARGSDFWEQRRRPARNQRPVPGYQRTLRRRFPGGFSTQATRPLRRSISQQRRRP
jgi:hypothetical protein